MANEEKSVYKSTNPTFQMPSDSRSQEESAYPGYHLAYEVKKLMYASFVTLTVTLSALFFLLHYTFDWIYLQYRNLLAKIACECLCCSVFRSFSSSNYLVYVKIKFFFDDQNLLQAFSSMWFRSYFCFVYFALFSATFSLFTDKLSIKLLQAWKISTIIMNFMN